jgi:ABC-type Fe3+-hydroxamate transport system substrate-binding protein
MSDSDETMRHEVPTRRDTIKYGGAVVGGGLLAGCTGDGSDSDTTNTPGEGNIETASESDTETDTPDDDIYTAFASPAGEVTFESVPEDAFTVFPWYADMAFALGHGDSINALWWADEFDSILQYFLADLEDVSTSWQGLAGEYGASKEQLYELDSDVHLVDPAWISTLENWNRSDIDEIAANVAPWFGNQYSNLRLTPPEDWADGYEYYTLWELFGKVAQVYREEARYEALTDVHDDLLSTIQKSLPIESERPTVAYVQLTTDLDESYVLRLNAPGYYNAHTRPLGATDAFADVEIEGEFRQIDFEALLDADPDVLLTLWGMTSTVDFETLRANLEEHSVGRELSAVQNDRVYTQGTRFQGPIMNLFQLEMTAKQLYPEQFGEWPGYVDGEPYPEFPTEEQLFDRQRVADIIDGDI